MCLCLVDVISLVRGNVHYKIHEAHVAQIERAIRRFEGVEDLADFLGEFSSPTMLVWSYRQGDDDAVMPPGRASVRLQNKELLNFIGYKSVVKEVVRRNFAWNGNRYCAHLIPVPSKSYSIGVMEDFGVDIFTTRSIVLALFSFWLAVTLLAYGGVELGYYMLIKPVEETSELMLSIGLDDLEDSRIMTEVAQETAPSELVGYLKQYSSLLARLQSDYANTKFIISGVGHEMRKGFSSVKNYVATLERPAIAEQEKRDAIRSCRAAISSSVNTLDNILRLAKNDSGLS